MPSENESPSKIIDSVRSLKPQEVALATCAFLILLSPGFVVLMQWQPEMLIELDVFKLMLLSASATCPILGVNFILTYAMLDEQGAELDHDSVVFFSCVVSLFVIYLPIVLGILFGFSMWWVFIAGLMTQIVVICILCVDRYYEIKKKKAEAKQSDS